MSDKLVKMAREILEIECDLPCRFSYHTGEHPTVNDFDVYIFQQVWGSTALGFNGIGGQAITSANTYVFIPNGIDQFCFVYFAGRFAYAVPYSDIFMEDVKKQSMEPLSGCYKYKRKVE